MISGARIESEPYRDHPLWREDLSNIHRSLQEEAPKRNNLLSPIVQFENAVEAYKMLDEKPEETIKLGVRHS